MAASASVPDGFGHGYTPQSHVDAWIAVTGSDDWLQAEISRLHEHLRGLEARD